jgi:hypothetical protein
MMSAEPARGRPHEHGRDDREPEMTSLLLLLEGQLASLDRRELTRGRDPTSGKRAEPDLHATQSLRLA